MFINKKHTENLKKPKKEYSIWIFWIVLVLIIIVILSYILNTNLPMTWRLLISFKRHSVNKGI